MSEVVKEVYPDSTKLLEVISSSEAWSPVYRRALEELFKAPALRAALRELLILSDEALKNVGMSDLTSPETIQRCIRQQGVATGLSQAVETLCALASTPEEKEVPEDKEN